MHYMTDLVEYFYKSRKKYLNDEFEGTGNIGIAADNNHNVDIAYSHVEKGATSNLAHRTYTKFFGLHDVRSEEIHHIGPIISSSMSHGQNITAPPKGAHCNPHILPQPTSR